VEVRVVVNPRGIRIGWLCAVLSCASCSIDRTPEFAATSRIQPVAGRVPVRTVDDRPSETDFGPNPTPIIPNSQPQTGGLRCGGKDCPFTVLPVQPCCTSVADVDRGAAREADRCGLDFSDANQDFFATACWQRDQLGVPDDSCPTMAVQSGVEEPGCCTEQGQCGALNTGHALGCHYQLDGPRAECGGSDIVEELECEPLGVFGVRTEVDVFWGGRSGGLAALTDAGRDKIVIHLKVVIDSLANGMEVRGSVQPCGVQLPPFYSTTLCESYQPIFPHAIWESPNLAKIPLAGNYQCLHPGCILTLEPQTSLLGIDLENSESPWPTPQQTPRIECALGTGVDCFPDHDADSLPGMTIEILTQGMAPLSSVSCPEYTFEGAPLSSSPAAIIDGVRRADRILLGTRTKLGGAGVIGADCNGGVGPGVAEFVQSRGWGCLVQEGTANWGGVAAGPDEACMAAEAAFMDENLPIYNVLRAGQAPDPMLSVPDHAPSEGPKFSLVRVGAPGESVTCAEIRDAAYP
jgi:hypothetical protein